MTGRLRSLLQTIDSKLFDHLESLNLQFEEFGMRWMNCLFTREFSNNCLLRLWDTYLSQEDGFEGFHVYVCVVMLVHYSEFLRERDFSDCITHLLYLPVSEWTSDTLEPILSQAFIFTTLYEGSPSHLKNNNQPSSINHNPTT